MFRIRDKSDRQLSRSKQRQKLASEIQVQLFILSDGGQSEYDDEFGGMGTVRQPVVQLTSFSQTHTHDSEKVTDIKSGEQQHTAVESRKHRTSHQSQFSTLLSGRTSAGRRFSYAIIFLIQLEPNLHSIFCMLSLIPSQN